MGLDVIILIIMIVSILVGVAWPAYVELSEGWNVGEQLSGEQIKLYDKSFDQRCKQLRLYTYLCGGLALSAGIFTAISTNLFLKEVDRSHFSADQEWESVLFMYGLVGLLVFLSLMYGLVVLRTKMKALERLRSEGWKPKTQA